MKPFAVHARALKSELKAGCIITDLMLGGGAYNETRTITKLAELDTLAAEVAAKAGYDCVVWIGPSDRNARKPAGLDREASRISKIFRALASSEGAA